HPSLVGEIHPQMAPTLEADDAALEGAGGRLSSIGYAELAEDIVDVTLHGRFADMKRARDLLIALPVHNLLKHLKLAHRQFRTAHAFGESFGNHRRQAARARMDLSNRVFQFLKK